MSLAATAAHLLVYIEGHDQLSPAVASASGSLSKLNETNKLVTSSSTELAAAQKYGVNLASNTSVAFGVVKEAATGMGNALSHAKGFVTNLVQGPLGMIGLGAAAFSLGGALKSGIDTANELAGAIEKLVPITGDSAEQVSALIAVFDKFGIDSAGTVKALAMMEKNVGNLTLTTAKAKTFTKEFGVSLVDATGHVKDANTILGLAADYFNSTATTADKAAFESKLFGRSWQAMIPILQLGSKGLTDAEKAAADLGLTLNAQNVTDLKAYQANMRDVGEAVSGLKLTLALELLPTLTDVAKEFTKFVTDHRTDIAAFFKNAISTARQVGAALVSVGEGLAGLWNKIPGPMQTLLLQALIGNKVIKTVFGIDIVGTVAGAVGNIGKDILGKLVGSLFGKTIATPVVNVDGAVVNVGGVPGLGGAAGGAGGAAEGAGAAAGGIGAGLAAAIAGSAALILTSPVWLHWLGQQHILGSSADKGPLSNAPTPTTVRGNVGGGAGGTGPDSIAGVTHAINQGTASAGNGTLVLHTAIETLDANVGKAKDDIDQSITLGTNKEGVAFQFANSALKNIVGLTSAQTKSIDGNLNLQRIANESHHKLTYAQLLAIQHTEHTDHLVHMGLVNKQLAKAQDIFHSSETNAQKVQDLKKIQADFAARKDWGPEAQVRAEIAILVPHLDGIRNAIGGLSSTTESHPGKTKDDQTKPGGTTHRSNTSAAGKSNNLGWTSH